jgi:CRP/FNR family transcriptional regulator, cyclic AMP receptor protein
MTTHSLLAALNEPDRQSVLRIGRQRRFARNDIVFHEGDAGNSVHMIMKGTVAIRVSTPMGEVATLTVLGRNDSFGELSLLPGDHLRTASAIAMEPLETLTIGATEFTELRRTNPAVTEVLVDLLASQVRRLSAQVLEALYLPAEVRVLRRLMDLAALYRVGEAPPVVPLTQEDIATMAGTTRPTVNQTLRLQEESGTVRLSRGRIEILDEKSIRLLAGL